MSKAVKFIALMPFAGTKALLTGDGRPFMQGAVLGAAALVLLTGACHSAPGSQVPMSLADVERMVVAASEAETIFEGRIDIMPLGLDEDVIPEFVPPIPKRKPDGYTLTERTQMNNLIKGL